MCKLIHKWAQINNSKATESACITQGNSKLHALETSASFMDTTSLQSMFDRRGKMINLGQIQQNGDLNYIFKQMHSKIRNAFGNINTVTV